MIDQRLFHIDIYNYGKYFPVLIISNVHQFYLITQEESN